MKCEKCGLKHKGEETCEETKARVEMLMKGIDIIKSGYAGILPNGNIVDRREFPEATEIKENPMLGVPKPKALPQPPSQTNKPE